MKIRSLLAVLIVLVLAGSGMEAAQGSSVPPTRRLRTVVGTCYRAQVSLLPVIQKKVAELRAAVRAQRERGKLVAYLSTPIGDYGVGYTPLNLEIADFVAARYQAAYQDRLWVLNPASVKLPPEAQGADYMYLWTQVLAGDDGFGQDFDLVLMTGPTDVAAFFEDAAKHSAADTLEAVDRWIESRAAADAEFKKGIAENPARRFRFRAYYAFAASTGFSAGAHDEWNLFQRVNERRRLRDRSPAGQLPVYFDGRMLTPAEMETPVSPGPVCKEQR